MAPVDGFGLSEAHRWFRERIVTGIADAADRGSIPASARRWDITASRGEFFAETTQSTVSTILPWIWPFAARSCA